MLAFSGKKLLCLDLVQRLSVGFCCSIGIVSLLVLMLCLSNRLSFCQKLMLHPPHTQIQKKCIERKVRTCRNIFLAYLRNSIARNIIILTKLSTVFFSSIVIVESFPSKSNLRRPTLVGICLFILNIFPIQSCRRQNPRKNAFTLSHRV